jgi:hypothetical protein
LHSRLLAGLPAHYRFCGALLALGTLVPLSYYDMNKNLTNNASWRWGGEQTVLERSFQPLAILALSVLVIGGSLLVILRRREGDPRLTRPVWAFFSRQWLPLGLVLLMTLLSIWVAVASEPLLPTVLANLGMLDSAWWLIGVGLREDRGRPFAAGVLYFLLWAVLRYIDLFGGFGGMLGGGLCSFCAGPPCSSSPCTGGSASRGR